MCTTMTNNEMMGPSPFHIKQMKDADRAIKFYTNFPTFLHLLTCYSFQGLGVASLCYNDSKCDSIPVTIGRPHALSPLNEFF